MITKHEFPSTSAWLSALLQRFQALSSDVLRHRDRMHVALSGGSTPRAFYEALADCSDLPWKRVEWWLGDERWVPPTDESSNEKMVRESLGRGDPDFSKHFHSWHLDLEAEGAASLYEAEIRRVIGEPPVFDLVLLGLGTDGHTASLFPGAPMLRETRHLTANGFVPQVNGTRLTLTYPALNSARQVWFLIQGTEKEGRVQELLSRGDIPAARVTALQQEIFWLKE